MSDAENVAFYIGIVFIFFIVITLVRLNYYKDNKAYIITLLVIPIDLMTYQVTNNKILFLSILVITSVCSSILVVVSDEKWKNKKKILN